MDPTDDDPQKMGCAGSSSEWDPEDDGLHVLDLVLTGIQKMMRWIWSWLMDQKDDALDLMLASGSEDAAPQKMHVMDLVKTKEKHPKAHAWA